MKICFLLAYHWSSALGGSELQVKYLIEELSKDNNDIYYLCEFAEKVDHGKIKVITLNSNKFLLKFGYSVARKRILKILHSINPNIIYVRANCGYLGIAAKYCKSNINCKLVFHIANKSNLEPYKLKFNKDTLILLKDYLSFSYGIKNADLIIGQAQYQNDILKTNYNRSCDEIIYNFHPKSNRIIEKDDKVISVVWVGNLKKTKQPQIFYDLAKCFLSRKNVRFYMIGRANSKWIPFINKFSKLENSSYSGILPNEEVNNFLSKSHILVNTSMNSYEGFPNVFIQAWMNKVPVVSLIVDPDDIISKYNFGYVSGNFNNMKLNINKLINDSKHRNKLGENAYNFAVEKFSFKNMHKLIEILHSLNYSGTNR